MKLNSNIIRRIQSIISISWKKNLLLISLSQFLAMVGMSAVVPFMPLYVVELGVKDLETAKLWSGFVFAGPYFLSIITVPIWGYLGDKFGKKLMILRAVFGLSIAVFLMGYAQNVYQLFGLRVFQGAVSGVIAAALAFTASNTPQEHSGYAIGILQSSQSAGNILGPFIGGLISDFIGIRFTFIFVALLILISGILVLFFVKEKKVYLSNLINNNNNFLDNLKIIINNKFLIYLMVLLILAQAGIQFTNPIFPFFVSSLGAPKYLISTITGLLIGIIGLMSVLFAPYWGRRNDRKDFRKTLFISSSIIGISSILHIIVPNYFWLIPLRVIIGIFFAAIIPTLYSTINKNSSADNKGSTMGLASSANLLGSLFAFVFCGIISSQFGLNVTFIIAGLLLLTVSFSTKLPIFAKQ